MRALMAIVCAYKTYRAITTRDGHKPSRVDNVSHQWPSQSVVWGATPRVVPKAPCSGDQG